MQWDRRELLLDIDVFDFVGDPDPWDIIESMVASKPKAATEQAGTGLHGGAMDGRTRQAGQGILTSAMAVISAVKGLDTLVTGQIGTAVSNTLSKAFNSNPDWKPGFAGEHHAVFETKHGLTRANFAGPGTNLKKRIPRGDRGVDGPNGIDEAARVHDIEYARAKDFSDVRRADAKFIKRVNRSSAGPKMRALVAGLMNAKNFGEDLGVLGEQAFAGNPDPDTLAVLDTAGEGKRRKKPKIRPGMRLKQKLKRLGISV